jgi:hypothetical protein
MTWNGKRGIQNGDNMVAKKNEETEEKQPSELNEAQKQAFETVFGEQTGAHKIAYVTIVQLERLVAELSKL